MLQSIRNGTKIFTGRYLPSQQKKQYVCQFGIDNFAPKLHNLGHCKFQQGLRRFRDPIPTYEIVHSLGRCKFQRGLCQFDSDALIRADHKHLNLCVLGNKLTSNKVSRWSHMIEKSVCTEHRSCTYVFLVPTSFFLTRFWCLPQIKMIQVTHFLNFFF